MWGCGPWGAGYAPMGWMMVPGFGVLILLIVLVFVATRPWRHGANCQRRQRGSSALELLEQRYARGEIERDEYLQKRQDLGGEGG